jgi:hypothetical protein
MSDISIMTGGPERSAGRPPVVRGKVLLPPTGVGLPMTVYLEGFSSDYHQEIAGPNWQPRPERLPQRDDPCVVTYDHLGDAWLQWGPAS